MTSLPNEVQPLPMTVPVNGTMRIPLCIPLTGSNDNHTESQSPISVKVESPTTGTIPSGIPSVQSHNFMQTLSDKVITSTPVTPRSSSHRKSSDHIKRPMNAFLIWSTQRRHQIKEKEPQITMAEISKRLGQEWKDMTMEERQPYIDRAKQIRADHMTKYPDYKYQPRRKKNAGSMNSKVKGVGGVMTTTTANNMVTSHVNSTNGQMPSSTSIGQYNTTGVQGTSSNSMVTNQQIISNSSGPTLVYQTSSGQPVLAARTAVQHQQLHFESPQETEPQHQEQQHSVQIGTTNSLPQSQQVVVTSPCLMPAPGGQGTYTVILPSNHNGLPLYLQAMPQQQSQALVQQQQILSSPQSGTLAQPPMQTSPQLQAAIQHHPQTQLHAVQSSLQPHLMTAGGLLVSGGSLQPIQTLTEGQVPFSQM